MRLAIHYLGGVRQVDGLLATNGWIGPLVEPVSALVDELTLVAWEPPPFEREEADRAEYEFQKPENVNVLSLGAKGSWHNYVSRRRSIHRLVSVASREWDVLVLRLVNRRVELVYRANRCPRVVSWIGGHAPSVVRVTPMRWNRKTVSLANAWKAEVDVRRILRSSGLTYVNSEELLRRYRRVAPHASILRTSSRSERFHFRAHDRLTVSDPCFLLVGRLSTAKGIYEAVEAFAGVVRSIFPDARLDVVGDGPERNRLEQRCRELSIADRTTFHGFLPVGPSLYERFKVADVMLFLSWAESLPRVVWEALAHSVIVIATTVGALPQAFSEEVFFVANRSPDEVVEAVRQLKDDPSLRRRLITKGFERAQEASVEKVAAGLLRGILERWPELI